MTKTTTALFTTFLLTFAAASLGQESDHIQASEPTVQRVDEYLVLRPFRFHERDIPENLRTLEREVSLWIAAWKGHVSGKHDHDSDRIVRAKIVPTGDAVVAWVEDYLSETVEACQVWRLAESGEWIMLELPLVEAPLPGRSSGSFLRTRSRDAVLDLRSTVPIVLHMPENTILLGISPEGNWVGREERHYVAGIVEGGQLKKTFPAHLDSQWDRDLQTYPSVFFLNDYDVAILEKDALVDFEQETIKPIKLPKTPSRSIGSPPTDELICHSEGGYARFAISSDGEAEELDDNWSVRTGDQIWATSPSGVYLGGRRKTLWNLLPGGVGPDVIRLNHSLAPQGARAPSLRGASFVGWVIDRPKDR